MDVRNCRSCGKLYNYVGGTYRNLCPNCISALEDKFQLVKEYIDEHHSAIMSEISEECGVSVKQIEQWVREERLFFSEDSPMGIACEGCGKTIKTGRFCEACKSSMVNQLDSAYKKDKITLAVKRERDANARMRFLDGK